MVKGYIVYLYCRYFISWVTGLAPIKMCSFSIYLQRKNLKRRFQPTGKVESIVHACPWKMLVLILETLTHTQTLGPQTHIHNLFPYIEKNEPCFPAAAYSGKLNEWRITVCKGLNTQVMHQTKAYSVVFVESWQDFAVIPLMSISKHSLHTHHAYQEDLFWIKMEFMQK